MRRPPFDLLSPEDYVRAASILRGTPEPDLIIAPDGIPYLYRWYVIPHRKQCNVYLHIQVSSDPGLPLHDHPWDNMSVILAGGYNEILMARPMLEIDVRRRKVGETVFRAAEWAHRLLLPKNVPYTMTLFSTGPKVRDWGFWYPQGWVNSDDVVRTLENGTSIHVHPK